MKKLLLLFAALCCTAMMQAEIVYHAQCDPTRQRGFTQNCWENTETGKIYSDQACTNELNAATVVQYPNFANGPVITSSHMNSYEYIEELINENCFYLRDACLMGDVTHEGVQFHHAVRIYHTFSGSASERIICNFQITGINPRNARLKMYVQRYNDAWQEGIIPYYVMHNYNIADQGVFLDGFKITTLGQNMNHGDVIAIEVLTDDPHHYGIRPYTTIDVCLEYEADPQLIIAADNKGKIMGLADPVLTWTQKGDLLYGEKVNVTLNRTAGETPGEYPIHVTYQTENLGSDVEIVTQDATFSILDGGDQGIIAIATDDKRKFKGTDDPELTYSVLSTSFSGNIKGISLSRDAGEGVGFYTIHASQAEGANPDYEIHFLNGTLEIVDGVYHVKGDPYSDTGLVYLQNCWEETATGKYYADAYLKQELKSYEVIGYPKLPSNPITATDGFTVKESATYEGVPFDWAAETTYRPGEGGTRTVEFTVTEPNIYNNNARLAWYISTRSGLWYGYPHYKIYKNNDLIDSYDAPYYDYVDGGIFFVPLFDVKKGDKIKFEFTWNGKNGTPTVAACLQYTCPSELYFMAQEAGSTVQLNKVGTPYDASLEYSTTGTTWLPYTFGQTITLANKGDRVYFRNASDDLAEGFSKGYMSDYYQFAMSGSIAAGGNVMSLLDKTCKSTALPDESVFCFANLFSGCTSLTSAPELPATQLVANCYYGMFNGCTGLTEAPALPATQLAASCYYWMFNGCTGLTEAPALPATTLSGGCYTAMFDNCTGLTEAPALPATTVAVTCYESMFRGCTSLTEAPELPAMTMESNCYREMFSGCTSLETAPALPATTLAQQCYFKMFYGCTSLTTAPELPATTVEDNCYESMFNGCTSLTAAPKLPATTLARSCYERMFYGCTKLNQVKVGFTNWGDMGNSYASDYRATSEWLSGVASTGIFVCPDALDKTKIGTSYIPEGWSVNGYNITVSSVGWASMYLPMAVTIPEGVKAYYAASVRDNVVTLNALTDAIPACTGVIVKAAAGTVTFPYTATAVTPIEGNLFEGVTCATPCDANANYVLNTSKCTADSPCFSNYTGTSLGAFKAYMPKSAVGGASSIQFRFGDTTAITPAETEVAEDVVYNLAGQRVSSDYRGIVIKNGKKMYIN